MTISVAAIVFKDPLTPVNISGLFVTITAIAVYNYMKIKRMREEARGETAAAISGPGASSYVPVDEDDDDDAVSTAYDPDLEGDSVAGTPALTRGETEGDRLI
jgi:solute carrier family 35 protein C2